MVDAYVDYAMMFVNPKGVQAAINAQNGLTEDGIKIVNPDAEEKLKQAKEGKVVAGETNMDIADRIKNRKQRLGIRVEEKVEEIEIGG